MSGAFPSPHPVRNSPTSSRPAGEVYEPSLPTKNSDRAHISGYDTIKIGSVFACKRATITPVSPRLRRSFKSPIELPHTRLPENPAELLRSHAHKNYANVTQRVGDVISPLSHQLPSEPETSFAGEDVLISLLFSSANLNSIRSLIFPCAIPSVRLPVKGWTTSASFSAQVQS